MTSAPTPATDAQISEWEYEAEQPHPNHQDWRILQLCARIKAEREQTIRECAALCQSWIDAPTFNNPILMYRPTVAGDIQDTILALLTNKGEQP